MAAAAAPGRGSAPMAAAVAPGSRRPFIQPYWADQRMEEDLGNMYVPPSPIIGKVRGTTEIVIANTASINVGMFQNAPPFYRGKVRCGNNQLVFREASILAFKMYESDRVVSLHHCLNLFKHPCIMNSLGYGYGSGMQEGYIFLAFPYFKSTLADFVDKRCDRTVNLERFTEEFIGFIENVVFGLLELHNRRYYCPNLSEEQIIILKEHNSICAKLWDFCAVELGNEKGKDMDWVRLGHILKSTAKNHRSYTIEVADLCNHMTQGTLKGIDILKHSAMLSVRAKFDNILALNTFVLAHCKVADHIPDNVPKANLHCSAFDQDNTAAMNELFCDPLDKDKTIATLKILLDSDVGWKRKVPLWIKERNKTLGFSLPKLNTFRTFVWKIRCLIEHENSFVAPEAHKKISSSKLVYSNIQPDLEYEIRQSWSHLFLVTQKFATCLQLKNT